MQACKDYTTFIEALREVSPSVIVDSDGGMYKDIICVLKAAIESLFF